MSHSEAIRRTELTGGDVDSGSNPVSAWEIARLLRQYQGERATGIGFPTATDIDYTELAPFFGLRLNNVGDPWTDPVNPDHAKELEREVIDFLADLFRAPSDDRWGDITSGGTERNLYGLYTARALYPDGVVYHSAAAHYSVTKAADLLALPAVPVRADPFGEIDYGDLGAAVIAHRDRPAIVLANVGTTMAEAVDDVARITGVLRAARVPGRYIHALAGLPLALTAGGPRFDFADGADSISVSGHKFLGTPMPCGAVLTRRSLMEWIDRPVAYTGCPDTTVTGSRSGHAALFLWYALRRCGRSGLRERAIAARQLAAYALDRLTGAGWEAWRHPHAFTVVLRTPPAEVAGRWALASGDGWSHVICMPGVTRDRIDRFVDDLRRVVSVSQQPTVAHPAADPVVVRAG